MLCDKCTSMLGALLLFMFVYLSVLLFYMERIGEHAVCGDNRNELNANSKDRQKKQEAPEEHEMGGLDDGEILNFENFNNVNGSHKFIVPNIVHLIYLRVPFIKFYQALCIYSIFLNHNPELIYIHCDNCSFTGYYWDEINSIEPLRKKIRIHELPTRNHIFGIKYGWIQHRADLWRLLILMNYGGIYLDNDVYVINPLHEFRRFEMVVSLEKELKFIMGNQVLIAHKNARFLKAHFDSYRTQYVRERWYYNGGNVSGKILKTTPQIAHLVNYTFGIQIMYSKLYRQKNWADWRKMHSMHLLVNHRKMLDKKSPIKEFDEVNIQGFNFTFGIMAREILQRIRPLIHDKKILPEYQNLTISTNTTITK